MFKSYKVNVDKNHRPYVKLTFTANADTTVNVYFTKESYDSGTPDDIISLIADQEKTTTYNRENIYIFKFVDKSPITSAKIVGALLNCEGLFYQCSNIIALDLSYFDTSKVTNMNSMFSIGLPWSGGKLTTLDVSNFDTSNVTDMHNMFDGCSKLTNLDVSNFDTSKVSNMSNMFQFCSSLVSLDISNFNTLNVTSMRWIVGYCSSLASLDLSNLNTSNVTNMSDMFLNCEALTSLDLSHFDTSKVTSMSGMFQNCSNLNTIGPVDTAIGWQHKPAEYKFMFNNCPATPKPSWYK